MVGRKKRELHPRHKLMGLEWAEKGLKGSLISKRINAYSRQGRELDKKSGNAFASRANTNPKMRVYPLLPTNRLKWVHERWHFAVNGPLFRVTDVLDTPLKTEDRRRKLAKYAEIKGNKSLFRRKEGFWWRYPISSLFSNNLGQEDE